MQPIWNTESGWLTEWDERSRQEPGIFQPTAQSCGWLGRMYVLSWALGLERFYWYTWNGGVYAGMVDEDEQATPLAMAYAVVRGWLLGAVMLTCRSDKNNTWHASLDRGGQLSEIVWNAGRPLSSSWFGNPGKFFSVKAPADWMMDLSSKQTRVGAGTPVAIGSRPVCFTKERQA
jgi:hypothetical protein